MEQSDINTKAKPKYTSTTNACKLCTPLGSSMAYKGIKGCVPVIHGSQGCATYIRRYMISHYREPMDIASTNFSEDAAIFGGEKNLFTALNNIINQYNPEIIAVSTTCLSETIGDDMNTLIKEYKKLNEKKTLPEIFYASTPSYVGTHAEGFYSAIAAVTKHFAKKGKANKKINIFPGLFSPKDLRYLKSTISLIGIPFNLTPDFSDTLDNPFNNDYTRIPEGGTSIQEMESMANALGSIELGLIKNSGNLSNRVKKNLKIESAATFLAKEFDVPARKLPFPVGIKLTDNFFSTITELASKEIPPEIKIERGRLVDAYIDGHKYLFNKKAIIYGEEDLVYAMVSFLDEIGLEVPIAATGGKSGMLQNLINNNIKPRKPVKVIEDVDFEEIKNECKEINPQILIGNSKGYYIAREIKKPLIRIGFPIHDRIGAQRIGHIGYDGTHELFERIVNAIIEYRQENSAVAYKYI
jgi:nitrogenase molybdenum-iron protein NifN